jgi:hypothetical protein
MCAGTGNGLFMGSPFQFGRALKFPSNEVTSTKSNRGIIWSVEGTDNSMESVKSEVQQRSAFTFQTNFQFSPRGVPNGRLASVASGSVQGNGAQLKFKQTRHTNRPSTLGSYAYINAPRTLTNTSNTDLYNCYGPSSESHVATVLAHGWLTFEPALAQLGIQHSERIPGRRCAQANDESAMNTCQQPAAVRFFNLPHHILTADAQKYDKFPNSVTLSESNVITVLCFACFYGLYLKQNLNEPTHNLGSLNLSVRFARSEWF